LKAPVIDNGEKIESEKGTPQGGIISPLLANIALNGMEKLVREEGASIVRYADDFVVLDQNDHILEKCKAKLAEKLRKMGLEFHPTKTKMKKLYPQGKEQGGIEFLGFKILQNRGGQVTIKPSVKSIAEHMENMKKAKNSRDREVIKRG